MHLISLRLYQFRNLANQQITLSPGANFIIGKNGQGKTNILEAVNFLSTSKSFRTAKPRELIQAGEKEFSVFAQILHENNETEKFDLGISYSRELGKQAFINGEETKSLAAFLGKLVTVSFSPDDIFLIKGEPSERRRFIDKHLVDVNPNIFTVLLEYLRALKNKQHILRAGGRSVTREELSPWNMILARAGIEIKREREKFLRELESDLQKFHEQISRTSEEIELRLKSNIELESEQEYFAFLESKAVEEIEREQAVYGIHRDDLLIKLGGMESRVFASQGQIRTLVLSLKFAVIELLERTREESPVILFDDVDAELDPGRSQEFFKLIMAGKRQVLVTGTQMPDIKDAFSNRDFSVYKVNEGTVEQSPI